MAGGFPERALPSPKTLPFKKQLRLLELRCQCPQVLRHRLPRCAALLLGLGCSIDFEELSAS